MAHMSVATKLLKTLLADTIMTDTSKDEQKEVPALTSRQKKFLKGLGHSLSPVVSIGKDGLGDKLVKATILELSRHELIKIKVGKSSPVSKHETAEFLLNGSSSSLVQIIGNTILLYKKNPDTAKDKQIRLPH